MKPEYTSSCCKEDWEQKLQSKDKAYGREREEEKKRKKQKKEQVTAENPGLFALSDAKNRPKVTHVILLYLIMNFQLPDLLLASTVLCCCNGLSWERAANSVH